MSHYAERLSLMSDDELFDEYMRVLDEDHSRYTAHARAALALGRGSAGEVNARTKRDAYRQTVDAALDEVYSRPETRIRAWNRVNDAVTQGGLAKSRV